jgi:polysaccharide biosynthesis transport protein
MTSNHNDPSPKKKPAPNQARKIRRSASSVEANSEQRNIRDYLLMIRERWFLGVVAASLLVGLLGYHQLRHPPVYEASATLMFESSNPQVVDIKEVVDTSLHDASADVRLQTHIGQMRSAAFFAFVASTFTDEEIEQIQRAYLIPEQELPSVRSIVQNNVHAHIQRGTFILTVSARHRDPEAAVLIANRYASRYIEYNRERTDVGNRSAVRFLRDQAGELLQKVQESEDSLHRYRRLHNLVSLEENQNTILRRLDSISASVVGARVARLELDSMLEHVQRYLDRSGNLMAIDYIAGYGSLARMHDELDQLLAERATLDERYLERHPRMVQNYRNIQSIQGQITETIEMAVTELRSRHQRALNHEQKLQEALAEAEEKSLELEEIAVRYNVLSRQAAADRDSYARIMERLSETEITSQLEEINIRMVDLADIPYVPVEPNVTKLLIQSAFLGSIILFGLPLGLGILDHKLKAAWEVEAILALPLVGEIPRISGLKRRDRPHIITQGEEHAACEAFRGIFSQMQLTSPLQAPHTLLITSTVPGEGKSLIANNLAATFANHGRRTLLIDCDFRRPSLHIFHERKNDRGIIRWLTMNEPDQEPLEPSEALGILPITPNLHLLRSGGESRRPTSMFDQTAFKSLFTQIKMDYDMILIDTPPVGIFPDSLLLAPLADQILYVCQFNRVNKTQIQQFVEKIELADVAVGGLILNGIPRGRASTFYDYYGYGQVGNKDYKAYYNQKR